MRQKQRGKCVSKWAQVRLCVLIFPRLSLLASREYVKADFSKSIVTFSRKYLKQIQNAALCVNSLNGFVNIIESHLQVNSNTFQSTCKNYLKAVSFQLIFSMHVLGIPLLWTEIRVVKDLDWETRSNSISALFKNPLVFTSWLVEYLFHICSRRLQLFALFLLEVTSLMDYYVADFGRVWKVAKRLDRSLSANSRSRLLLKWS